MPYLSNFKLTDRGIEPVNSSFSLMEDLATQAFLLCRTDGYDPKISDLEELVEFTLRELLRAGERGAEWFRSSIKDASIADNDYTRQFCTAEGYIKKEGEVNVLITWACSIRDNGPLWENSPIYVRALHQRHYARLMAGSFALYKLNAMIGISGRDSNSFMEELAIVVDALLGGSYNHGWADCEQIGEDERSANGKAGVKARDEQRDPTRKWVVDQYASGQWPSPRAASFELAPKANEMLRAVGKPLSEQRAQTTVYEWLLKDINAKKAKRHS